MRCRFRPRLGMLGAAALSAFFPVTEGCTGRGQAGKAAAEAEATQTRRPASTICIECLMPSSLELAWAETGELAGKLKAEPSPFERINIIQEIAAVGGEPAVSKLAVALISEPESFVRGKIIDALAAVGNPARMVLELALKDEPHPVIRATAAMRLGGLGDARAVDALIESLHDPEGLVRCESITALTLIGEREKTIPALIAVLLNDPYLFAKTSSIFALEHFGDSRALYPLVRKMKYDPEILVSGEAVRALGLLGDLRAVDSLLEALKGMRWRPDYRVLQRLSAWSLAQFSGIAAGGERERIVRALREASQNDESQGVRMEAESALAFFGE